MSDSATAAKDGSPSQSSSQQAEITSDMAVKALIPLLITFVLGTLCLQGFNLVFQEIGESVGAPGQASLITAIPSIVLGIVCFIYGSLGDFVSLKKLVVVGITLLVFGSVLGFVANYYFTANIWTVIVARAIQTAGEQVAGSVYLVVATKYLKDSLKVIFFGIFTAGYQISAAIGVFAAGFLTSIHWQYLFLIPAVTVLFLPLLLKNLPNKTGNGEKVDVIGFTIFGPHKRRSMRINSMQREEPYLGLTCAGRPRRRGFPSGPVHRWCMVVVSSCREMLGQVPQRAQPSPRVASTLWWELTGDRRG